MNTNPTFFNPNLKIQLKRNHLPHWYQPQAWIFATWRLADSLPLKKLSEIKIQQEHWMSQNPKPWDSFQEESYFRLFTETYDKYLDKGFGSCLLKTPEVYSIISETILHKNHKEYHIQTFVVMPNHVHVVFYLYEQDDPGNIIGKWKGYSAYRINKLMGTKGKLWQKDYWDRIIRSEFHFHKTCAYTIHNPQKAKLKKGNYLVYDSGIKSQ